MKINEENFLKQLRRRNEQALDYVIDNYGWIIKSVVKKHLYNLQSVQNECINDVLLGLWNNIDKFDSDFMFELTDEKLEYLRCKNCTANISSKSRYNPHVFGCTEI